MMHKYNYHSKHNKFSSIFQVMSVDGDFVR